MADTQMYDTLIQQVLANNPEMSQYAGLFQQLMANDSGNDSEVSEKVRELELRMRKAKAFVRELKEDLDDANDRLYELAKALGACEDCWGEDRRCPSCHGQGSPGHFPPDQILMTRLVMPAVHKAPWVSKN